MWMMLHENSDKNACFKAGSADDECVRSQDRLRRIDVMQTESLCPGQIQTDWLLEANHHERAPVNGIGIFYAQFFLCVNKTLT